MGIVVCCCKRHAVARRGIVYDSIPVYPSYPMAFRGLNSPVIAPTNDYSCQCSRPKKPTIWGVNLLPIYVNTGDGLLLALPHCTETWFNAVDQLPHIDIAAATGLLGEGFLPPAQSERLGFPEFFRWCLGDGTDGTGPWHHMASIIDGTVTVTNDSAGKWSPFRVISGPLFTQKLSPIPSVANGWNLLADSHVPGRPSTYCGIHPPSKHGNDVCWSMGKTPMFFTRHVLM